MRSFLFNIALISISLSLLSSCNQKGQNRERIVTVTVLPQQFFAERIAGDKFEVHCMVPRGSSPESYDPTPAELMKLSKSMAYFKIGYMGFELSWMDKIASMNPGMSIFDTSVGVDLIYGTHVCSDPAHHHEDDHGHDHEGGVDPHTWSAPSTSRVIARNMLDAFVSLDKENESYYRTNFDQLMVEIDSVDSRLKEILAPVQSRTFAIYHPALAYFARDYGLEQISFEHEGKEPSVQHLASLSKQMKDKGVKVVFVQQEFDQKNGELLAKESNSKLIQINPLSIEWGEELIRMASAIAGE